MDVIKIKVDSGRETGSGPARRLREAGKIPGVVYGLGSDPTAVAVDYGDLRRAMSGEAGLNAVLSLDLDGVEELSVVKDLQRDPLKQLVTHVDFLRVDPNAEIEVDVPINLIGEAVEMGRENGIVQQIMFSMRVLAKPGSAPSVIDIDITDLMIGDNILVSDIPLPNGATSGEEPDVSIVAGQMTRAALVEEDTEEGEGEEGEGGESEGGDGDAASEGSED